MPLPHRRARRRRRLALLGAVIGAASGLTGCATARVSDLEVRYARGVATCTPRPTWPATLPEQLEPRLTDAHLTALGHVPADVRRAAYAARAEHALAELVLAHVGAAAPPGRDALLARLDLQDRLRGLAVEVAAARYEIDCLGDRVEALRDDLARRDDAHEGTLTVWSIAVGAVFGVAAGVWELADGDSRAAPWLGIVGGAASAGLGVAALSPPAARARLNHPRDPLAPIWTGRDPQRVYGTFVWRLLGSIPAGADETPRERLARTWRGVLERDARDPEATAALLFGGGGMYDAEVLALREALLDDLEAEVDAMYRELERIDRFVRRLDTALPPPPPAAQEAP